MPNTYDYRVLRRMYQDKFGAACTLGASRVTEIWASTRPTPDVRTRETYDRRAAQTLEAMRDIETGGAERSGAA
jgi:hypothetical protein